MTFVSDCAPTVFSHGFYFVISSLICPVVHAEQQIYRNRSNIVLKESIWNTVTFYFQN